MNRDDIHIISRHSNWSIAGVNQALKDGHYADIKAWKKFLQLLLITLGIGFTTAGILFFFAYNWADLHKFIKIGMIEGLIMLTSSLVLFTKLDIGIKNILLTAAAVLVGILFAVFGQIYQTGANAYDFFLGWTVFITLWVIISNFPPLWIVFLTLLNTTFVLYSQQMAEGWSEIFVFLILFLFNSLIFIFLIYFRKFKPENKFPKWFTNTIVVASIGFSTIGIIAGVFEEEKNWILAVFIIIAFALYLSGIIYGIKTKSGFFLSIIPFSIIIIISALLIKISDGAAMFFMLSLFIIASISFLIKTLIDLQKKWYHE
ncbi:MAG: DUF2157 domain-containing protein [Bacteroidales bacterium]